jgi:hypothetical protein
MSGARMLARHFAGAVVFEEESPAASLHGRIFPIEPPVVGQANAEQDISQEGAWTSS